MAGLFDGRPVPRLAGRGCRTAGFGAAGDNCYETGHAAVRRATQESIMAKGQQRSNKEARKPKKEKPKSNAANPSSKGSGGLTKG
jgi:hypothetical protein